FFHHVFHVFAIHGMRLYGGLNVVLHRPVFRVGDIVYSQQPLRFFPALVGDHGVLVLLVYHVVTGVFLWLSRRLFNLLAFFQVRDHAIGLVILVSGFIAGAADDQRCARFINQDGIHFVHNAVIVPALYALSQVKLHVVAQVIEAEFVVGAVGHVG